MAYFSVPDSVARIGEEVFNGCIALKRIKVSGKNNTYDSRKNCNAIIHTATNTLIAGCKNTIIPDTVSQIGNGAFAGCEGLSSISIPDSVKNIGSSAFSGCDGLTSITIPDSVTHIGDEAFWGCSGLRSITIPATVAHIGNRTFYSCNALSEIHIPAGNYDQFKKLLPDLDCELIED